MFPVRKAAWDQVFPEPVQPTEAKILVSINQGSRHLWSLERNKAVGLLLLSPFRSMLEGTPVTSKGHRTRGQSPLPTSFGRVISTLTSQHQSRCSTEHQALGGHRGALLGCRYGFTLQGEPGCPGSGGNSKTIMLSPTPSRIFVSPGPHNWDPPSLLRHSSAIPKPHWHMVLAGCKHSTGKANDTLGVQSFQDKLQGLTSSIPLQP